MYFRFYEYRQAKYSDVAEVRSLSEIITLVMERFSNLGTSPFDISFDEKCISSRVNPASGMVCEKAVRIAPNEENVRKFRKWCGVSGGSELRPITIGFYSEKRQSRKEK